MSTPIAIPVKSSGFVSRRIGVETIVVPVRAGVGDLEAIFTMNGVGSSIWERIDGKTTVDDLGQALAREYEVNVQEAAADVAAFVELLGRRGLVELLGRRGLVAAGEA